MGAELAGSQAEGFLEYRTKKARCGRSGLSQEENTPHSMAARLGRLPWALLQVLFEKLHQTVNQPAAAANHMQPALMLMLLQNMIQFGFQFGHRNISRIRLTRGLCLRQNPRLLFLP